MASSSPEMSTTMTPPRGMALAAMRQRLSRSLTEFLDAIRRAALHCKTVRPLAKMSLAAFSASPVSINAPNEPAAPNARRQNWRRAEAEIALFLMSSMAMARISSSCSPSSTSRPLTIAPTGLITSWHTREQSSAARSSGVSEAIIKLVDPGFDIGTLAETETVSPFVAFDPSLANSLHGRDESLQINAMNEGTTT